MQRLPRRRESGCEPSGLARRAGSIPRRGLGLAFLLALACGPAGRSQSGIRDLSPRAQARPMPQPFPGISTDSHGDFHGILVEKRLRALNIERQKQLVADTNKLLKLAKELNEEVAASNTGTLTPEQLRKVAEIEKLARSVKERMADEALQPTAGIARLPASAVLYPSRLLMTSLLIRGGQRPGWSRQLFAAKRGVRACAFLQDCYNRGRTVSG